jgi:hypothetical protein
MGAPGAGGQILEKFNGLKWQFHPAKLPFDGRIQELRQITKKLAESKTYEIVFHNQRSVLSTIDAYNLFGVSTDRN